MPISGHNQLPILFLSVFGGEVDCTSATDPKADAATVAKHYVELKTTYEFKHAGQEKNFKR